MKILYIDIDGVICTKFREYHPEDREHLFEPHLVTNLNQIFKETNCQGVISSTWRLGCELNELRMIFVRRGFKYPDRIIDVTPRIVFPWGSGSRQEEIQLDLGSRKPEVFCIIDDANCKGYAKNWVKCNGQNGLTDSKMKRAIKILNF